MQKINQIDQYKKPVKLVHLKETVRGCGRSYLGDIIRGLILG